MHTAEGYTHILSSERTCDRLSKTGLTYSRRAVEAKDRRFHVTLELKNRQILYDSFLDGLETEVVLIQHLLRILQVEIVIRNLTPWEVQHELDIVVLDAVVRRARIISLELCHFLLENLLHLRWPEFFFRTSAKLCKLLHIIHSQLFLNGLELIVEVIFPLLLVDFRLDLLIDLLLDLLEFELGIKHGEKLHSPCTEIAELKELDLVHEILNFDGCSDEVDKEFETVDVLDSGSCLTHDHMGHAHKRGGLLLERLGNHPCLIIVLRRKIIKIMHSSKHIRFIFHDRIDLESLESLKDSCNRTVRHLESLHDLGNSSEIIEILLMRVLDRQIILWNSADECIVPFRIFDETDGLFPADGNRIYRTWEKNRISQCEYRKTVREVALVYLHKSVTLHHWNYAHFRTL